MIASLKHCTTNNYVKRHSGQFSLSFGSLLSQTLPKVDKEPFECCGDLKFGWKLFHSPDTVSEIWAGGDLITRWNSLHLEIIRQVQVVLTTEAVLPIKVLAECHY